MGNSFNTGRLINGLFVDASGNVGIGTTTPAEKLSVIGNIRIDNGTADGGQLVLASSGFSDWNLDNFSGRFRAYYGSTEYFTITSAGSVGIGTSTLTAGIPLSINVATGNNCNVAFQENASDKWYLRNITSSNAFSFYSVAGSNEVMRLTSDSKVGINESSPLGTLHARGTANADTLYRLEPTSNSYAAKLLISSRSSGDGGIRYGSGGGNNLDIFSYDTMRFYCGTANLSGAVGDLRMVITQAGNVGIGTSSPDNLLDLYGTGTNTTRIRVRGTTNFALFQAQNDSSSALYMGIDSSTASGFGVGNYSRIIWSGGAYPLVIATNDVERMRIQADGRINSTMATNNTNTHYIIHSGTSPFGINITYSGASPNSTGNNFIYLTDSTTARFVAQSNGGLANYQSNNVNLSDERTKKDIFPLESYWNKFKAIEIVKFKYIDQTHNDFNIGVIAQQVESVAPEFIDVDGFGETPEDGIPYKTVYTSDLHHATIKVLQEAMAKIEELEAKVTALENK